jgi:hypothetical protein
MADSLRARKERVGKETEFARGPIQDTCSPVSFCLLSRLTDKKGDEK